MGAWPEKGVNSWLIGGYERGSEADNIYFVNVRPVKVLRSLPNLHQSIRVEILQLPCGAGIFLTPYETGDTGFSIYQHSQLYPCTSAALFSSLATVKVSTVH